MLEPIISVMSRFHERITPCRWLECGVFCCFFGRGRIEVVVPCAGRGRRRRVSIIVPCLGRRPSVVAAHHCIGKKKKNVLFSAVMAERARERFSCVWRIVGVVLAFLGVVPSGWAFAAVVLQPGALWGKWP